MPNGSHQQLDQHTRCSSLPHAIAPVCAKPRVDTGACLIDACFDFAFVLLCWHPRAGAGYVSHLRRLASLFTPYPTLTRGASLFRAYGAWKRGAEVTCGEVAQGLKAGAEITLRQAALAEKLAQE